MLLVCNTDVQYVMMYFVNLLDFDVHYLDIQTFYSEQIDGFK